MVSSPAPTLPSVTVTKSSCTICLAPTASTAHSTSKPRERLVEKVLGVLLGDEQLERKRGAEESAVARKILDWARANMPSIWWGEGQRSGSFIPGLDHGGIWHQAIGVRTYGSVELQFQYMQSQPPFDDEAKRLELLHRLNEISGIDLSEDAINRRPSVPLSILVNQEVLERFLETLTWFTDEVRSA